MTTVKKSLFLYVISGVKTYEDKIVGKEPR